MFSPITSFISNKLRKRKMEKQGLTGSRKRKKQEESLSVVVDKSKSLQIFILALLFLASLTVLLVPNTKKSTQFVIGQTAHQTVYAEINFSYEDKVQTDNKRNIAMSKVPFYYRIDKNKTKVILTNLELLLSELLKKYNLIEKGKNYKETENKISRLVAEYPKESLLSISQIIQEGNEQKAKLISLIENYLDEGLISSRTIDDDMAGHYASKICIIDSENRIITKEKLSIIPPSTAIENISGALANYYAFTNRKSIKFAIRLLLLFPL